MRRLGVLALLAAVALGGTPEGKAAFEQGDYANALKELQPAAEAGDKDAQFLVGEIFRRGLGLRASPRMATKWYQLALAQSHAGAAGELGIQLWQARKRKDAVPLIRQGAEGGYGRAAYALALFTYRGDKGVGRLEPDKMYALFKSAAEQGHADAQEIYASALKRGKIGGKKDFAAAEVWYRKAAEQGHPYAFAGVASCLWEQVQSGRGTNITALREALEWYERGALHGDHAAQHFLALGQLARQAYVPAYVWAKIGANARYSLKESNPISKDLKKAHVKSLKDLVKKVKQYTKPEEVRAGDGIVKKYIKEIRANMAKGLPYEELVR